MSAAVRLRTVTQPLHDRVDAAFGAYRLDEGNGYRTFLRAHALALPAVEEALASATGLPAWRRRAPLLIADLGELDEPVPAPLAFDLAADAAAAWGALYVVEGSRLGGVMLARGVPGGWPSRYLAAAHLPGEWHTLREAIDAAGETGGPDWLAQAEAGATATFALYERAATLA